MGKRTAVLMVVVVMVLVWTEACRGWEETANERVNVAEKDTDGEAEGETASWTNWASDKMSTGFDTKREEAWQAAESTINQARDAMEKAYDKAGKAKDHANNKARYVYDKAEDAKQFAYDRARLAKEFAFDKLMDAKDFVYDKANRLIRTALDKSNRAYDSCGKGSRIAGDVAADKAGDAKESMQKAIHHGKDKAKDGYDISLDKAYDFEEGRDGSIEYVKDRQAKASQALNEALDKVTEKYETAKETVSRKAKDDYEAAKEKASEATGEFGAWLRQDGYEL